MRGGWFSNTAAFLRCKGLFRARSQYPLTRRARQAFVLVLLSILAGGCTPWQVYKSNGYLVGPNYCRPSADISERWIDADDKRLSSEEPDLTQWWTAFDDPKLNSLIQTACQ